MNTWVFIEIYLMSLYLIKFSKCSMFIEKNMYFVSVEGFYIRM